MFIKDTYTVLFVAVLFTNSKKDWKQPKYTQVE